MPCLVKDHPGNPSDPLTGRRFLPGALHAGTNQAQHGHCPRSFLTLSGTGVSSGYTTRRRLELAPADGLLAIQLGDIHGDDTIRAENLHRYQFEAHPPDRYLAHGGEVLFKSRGDPSTAAVVSTPLGEPAVVILPLLILRPHPHLVRADYLAWAINQPDAQHRLNKEAQGTSLRMIPKTVLERLDIPLPDLDTQGRITTIHALAQREGRLLHSLAHRRQQRTGLVLREQARLAQHRHHPQ